jgi:CRISPR-associated endoribonuclease Cas6
VRVRLDISTSATSLPWKAVLSPGRGIAYDLIARVDRALGRDLHEDGWGPHGMVPFGYGAPIFPTAKRQRGVYAAGGKGFVEFGSPLPEVIEAWATELRRRELLDWGGTAIRVLGLSLVDPPEFRSGRARMRTDTPVVLKLSHQDVEDPAQRTWLLPTEPHFPEYFQLNLRRKAETLGLSPDISLESIAWVGPKRSFAVGSGAKPGAPVEVDLWGEPETLRAIWSWGLGQANSAGFGWVGTAR